MGGSAAAMSNAGLKVGALDLTRGEFDGNAKPDVRQREAFEAGVALRLALRENLHLSENDLFDNRDAVTRLIVAVRKFRPRTLFAPHPSADPIHRRVVELTKQAVRRAASDSVKTSDKGSPQTPASPTRSFFYRIDATFEPSFYADVTDAIEAKLAALGKYRSLENAAATRAETTRARAIADGADAGATYAEPFYAETPVLFDLVGALR
jgi:LmbE family N-acetylglucosaminyl deacetylase